MTASVKTPHLQLPANIIKFETEGASNLMYACQQGRKAELKSIIAIKPESIKERDRTRKSALHYCAENSSTGCAETVLELAPDLVNAGDDNGYTPLHLAVISGNKPLIRLLLSHGADVNSLDNERHSVVHWATVCGEMEALELVLAAGAPCSSPDIHGGYPLHYAAQMCGPGRGLAILKTLLKHGVDVNVSDQDDRQPILWAASAGSSEAVLTLVNSGAKVEAEDKDGLTALHCAASRGHGDCIDTLLSLCGASVDVLDNNGCTALFYAVTLGHADATRLLLKYGALANRQDRKGRTPAHCGAAKGQMETLRLLSSRGANMWTRNVKGDYPLHEAVSAGSKDLVRWLLAHRPDAVNASNNDGRCPLHIAALNNNVELCKILLDVNSLVNPVMKTSKGGLMTPLDAALYKGWRSCAKYLQLHGGVPANRLTSQSAALRGPTHRFESHSDRVMTPDCDITMGFDQRNSGSPVHSPLTVITATNTLQIKVGDRSVSKCSSESSTDNSTRRRRRKRRAKRYHKNEDAENIAEQRMRRSRRGGEYPDSSDEEIETHMASKKECLQAIRQNNSDIQDKQIGTSLENNRKVSKVDTECTNNLSYITDKIDEGINAESNKTELIKSDKTVDQKSSFLPLQLNNLNEEIVDDINIDERNLSKPSELEEAITPTEADLHDTNSQQLVTALIHQEDNLGGSHDNKLPDNNHTIKTSDIEIEEELKLNTNQMFNAATDERKLHNQDDRINTVTDLAKCNADTHREYEPMEIKEIQIPSLNTDTVQEQNIHETPKDSKEKSSNMESQTYDDNNESCFEIKTVHTNEKNVLTSFDERRGNNEACTTDISTIEQKTTDLCFLEQEEVEGSVEYNELYSQKNIPYQRPSADHVIDKDIVNAEYTIDQTVNADNTRGGETSRKIITKASLTDNKTPINDSTMMSIHLDSRTNKSNVSNIDGCNDVRIKDGTETSNEPNLRFLNHDGRSSTISFSQEIDSDSPISGNRTGADSSQFHDSGFEPSPRRDGRKETIHRKSLIPTGIESKDNRTPLSTQTITLAVQKSIRKYHLERRIFHVLLELKRLQIRAGRSNEAVLVKRLVDDYRRTGIIVGLRPYDGVFTFRKFEKYLYDQLRSLQTPDGRVIPRIKSPDDLDKCTRALRKTSTGSKLLDNIPQNPILCTHGTHRCYHATHAYTGIPCAAYIPKLNHHFMPKTSDQPGFLPRINSAKQEDDFIVGRCLRYVDPCRPVTLALSHGNDRQVIYLPTEKLNKTKRYYVAFTIKGGDPEREPTTGRHSHSKSV